MSRQTQDIDISGVNYVQAKKDFLMLAGALGQHPKYIDIYRFFRRDSIEKLIELKLNNAGLARHEKYEVVNINGVNKLFERKKWPWVNAQCLCWEEMFDLFMPLHVEIGHRDHYYLSRKIKQMMVNHGVEYKYPWIALSLFHKACNICALNNKKLRPVKVCSLHAIAMAQRKLEDKFKYLLIYTDLDTFFTVLRPLMEKSHQEISTELYKIFMQFGPPDTVLMHGYNPKLSENVENMLAELCPASKIQIKHRPVKYELPTIVTDRIDAWMKRTKKVQWEVGCFIVQAELNNSQMLKPELKPFDITPYELQFHIKTFDKTLLENDDDDTYSRNRSKNQSKASETNKQAVMLKSDLTKSSAVNNETTSTNQSKILKPNKEAGRLQRDLTKSSGVNNATTSTTNQSNSSAESSKYTFLDAYLTQLAQNQDESMNDNDKKVRAKKQRDIQWENIKKLTKSKIYSGWW